jgi:putative glutathione S-transferase
MGKLIEGQWVKQSVITSDQAGKYDREPRSFLQTIAEDHERFQPESGRYHLYVSYACPWATRTLIYRELKGLQNHIGVSVVHPHMLDEGWSFATDIEGCTGDLLYGKKFLREIYQMADPRVTTTVTVPILWDKKHETVVNNESSQIIRIFNKAFDSITGNHEDYYPVNLQTDIDHWNERIYHKVNNGVYKTGFAKNQEAYESAASELFQALDEIDQHLQSRDYLVGDQLTEADLRLIPTLLRFDSVYHTHFKCNWQRIGDYKNLGSYTQRLYETPGIRNTTNFLHMKQHYYYSHPEINPHRIVPLGPKNNL